MRFYRHKGGYAAEGRSTATMEHEPAVIPATRLGLPASHTAVCRVFLGEIFGVPGWAPDAFLRRLLRVCITPKVYWRGHPCASILDTSVRDTRTEYRVEEVNE